MDMLNVKRILYKFLQDLIIWHRQWMDPWIWIFWSQVLLEMMEKVFPRVLGESKASKASRLWGWGALYDYCSQDGDVYNLSSVRYRWMTTCTGLKGSQWNSGRPFQLIWGELRPICPPASFSLSERPSRRNPCFALDPFFCPEFSA